MIRILTVFLTLILANVFHAKSQSVVDIQDSALKYLDVFRGDDDSLKMVRAEQLEDSLFTFFSKPENFDQTFDTLRFLGQLTSDDGLLRLITFNYPIQNGEFKYHCIILFKRGKEQVQEIHRLTDNQGAWDRINNRTLTPDQWYGALYYRIVQNRYKRKTYYTLLGWDGNNIRTNRKVIDVLDMNTSQPRIGMPIFEKDTRPQNRLIYEYANDASMSLNYIAEENLIVMDGLGPEHPRLEGQYQFYGPDLTYNALEFKKGKWLLIENHNAENRSLNGFDKDAKPGDFED